MKQTKDELSAQMRAQCREDLLTAGVAEALAVGWANLRRRNVAARAGRANGSVNHAFGSMDGLRTAVMEAAIADGHYPIIRAGLAADHPVALAAPDATRRKAMTA